MYEKLRVLRKTNSMNVIADEIMLYTEDEEV